jgi:WD40 repeat protein
MDKTIKIWDATTGIELKTMTGHGGNIYDIVFTSDSKYVVSASADNSARMWDLSTGKTIRTFPGHEKFVFCLAISPDNAYLLTGSQDAAIKLWDIQSAECIYTFYGHKDAVNALAFHPSGDTFISGSADRSVMIWKLAPEIYIEHYLSEEYQVEIKKSTLFEPKGENESKADYKLRMGKAELFRINLTNQLYHKYQMEIKGK